MTKKLGVVGVEEKGFSGSPWLLLAQWRPGMGQEGTNATNPKGLQPSGFTEAGPSGRGALIPVGSNVRKGFGGKRGLKCGRNQLE